MQIIDKGSGNVTIKLNQAEARRCRDAVYIARRAAKNLEGAAGEKLKAAADDVEAFVNAFCSSTDRLDREDEAIGVPG